MFVINSGKLYGPARRRAAIGPLLTREDKDRRIRDHVRVVAAELPDRLHGIEGVLPNGQKIVMYVRDLGGLLSAFADRGDVSPRQLTGAFEGFETACREQGLSPSRPDTLVGSLARHLRDEVMYVADYLASR
jgi:hypothetical protein